MKRAFAVLLLAPVLACGGGGPTGTTSARLGEPFDLRPGEVAFVSSGLRVEFLGVVSDSRCPTGVQCIWEGDATVRLTVLSNGRRTLELHTSARFDQEAAFDGYLIALEGVDPQPSAGVPIPPADYVARLRVDRRTPHS